jgi:hypothetical protein
MHETLGEKRSVLTLGGELDPFSLVVARDR